MTNNPIADQIVDTLTNLRREISMQGITAEADMLWQHALSLYRMRRRQAEMSYSSDPLATRREVDFPAADFFARRSA